MSTNRYYNGPNSRHFDGQRFFNPGHPDTDRSLLALLRWRLGEKPARWPLDAASRDTVPERKCHGLRITMVGHACLLIQAAGRNILVDPVWSQRASPVAWAGPRRVSAPGIRFEHLPPIDTVLITHNHFDHLDIPTLRLLWDRFRPRIIAPLGNDAVVAAKAPGIAVETADWGQMIGLDPAMSVWLHPAHHWSARGIRDRRMALWSGFVLETSAGRVYIAGDTAYGDGQIFRDMNAQFGPIDVAILPIGAYDPRWFMKDQHANPEEAVQIMLDCGARQALGVHWGCFPLTSEPRMAPKDRLIAELARRGLPENTFIAMAPADIWEAPI